ncbi:hypothetical protein [uncultured Erythrobacter sp.]|uniref:hypothetical protein n=1 Tax=uncultured Erythrobacter sp. TaxID=263913 RepID=UPI00265832CF|nr:hypothetical protein [uncultured Erythrobacter sp.]
MTQRRNPKLHRLIALAFKIAPPERKSWVEAMVAELDHVPEAKRMHFAAGCLVAAGRERLGSPQFFQAASRNVLIVCAMLWAALNIRFAGRMSVSDAFALEAYGYCTALLFLIGAVATARFGVRATISLIAPLILALTATAAFIRLGSAPTPTSHLYLALIVENLAVLVCALVVAGAAARFATVRKGLN